MKIKDFISKSIQTYPSLYKDTDYEKTKLKVLNHIFFVIGNGLELAETENIEEGGYVVEPVVKRNKHGEYERVMDKPYGKDKYKALPKDYFETIVYYVYPIEKVSKKGSEDYYFQYKKTELLEQFEPKLYRAESLHPFSPYPISKGYGIASEVYHNNLFLQADWLEELVILCKRTLEYYRDENQYKNSLHYPSENRVNQDLKHFTKTLNNEGVEGLKKHRKLWGYEEKDTVPDAMEITVRKNTVWKKFHAEQIEFLNKLIDRYDK